MVVEIVEIYSENGDCTMVSSDRIDDIHQRRLAMKTTIGIVALVVEVLEFGSFDPDPFEVPFNRKRFTFIALT